MDVNRPRLPPDLHPTDQYNIGKSRKDNKSKTPTLPSITDTKQRPTRNAPSSAPIGASSLSQSQDPAKTKSSNWLPRESY